jgi:hypothetical protein
LRPDIQRTLEKELYDKRGAFNSVENSEEKGRKKKKTTMFPSSK